MTDQQKIERLENVLAILIAWLARELGEDNARQLLTKLDPNGEIGSRISL